MGASTSRFGKEHKDAAESKEEKHAKAQPKRRATAAAAVSFVKPKLDPEQSSGSEIDVEEVIERILDDFMANEQINNPAIPDFIERMIYRNVLKLVIGVAEEMVGSTTLEFLGHRVTASMSPVSRREKTFVG